ncbi:hypothetical protein J6590_032949 [Homalodisca vitripennis]|nr:hypothetical protein J6590_032949 [Homalodisca vitripennis]
MCKSRTNKSTSRTGIEHETYSALGNKEETLNDVSNLGTGVQEEVDQTNPIQVSLANNDLESDQNTITVIDLDIALSMPENLEQVTKGSSNTEKDFDLMDDDSMVLAEAENVECDQDNNIEEDLLLVDSCELQAVTENSAGVAEDNNIEEDLQDKLQTEEEILSEESENQERPVTGRPKKGRKRKYPDQTREVRKKRKIRIKSTFLKMVMTSFVQTLRISTKRVDTALKKAKSSDSMRDKRGQAGGSNRLTEGRKEEVVGVLQRLISCASASVQGHIW